MRRVNDEKRRSREAHLIRDLQGDLALVTVWSGLVSGLGRRRSTVVSSAADWQLQIETVWRRRRQRD
jgi:hypothetical protein